MFFKIGGGELLEEIDSCYGRFGEEETIVVCRSNKRANRFNEGIRRTILYREEDFCSGDRIMIVKTIISGELIMKKSILLPMEIWLPYNGPAEE